MRLAKEIKLLQPHHCNTCPLLVRNVQLLNRGYCNYYEKIIEPCGEICCADRLDEIYEEMKYRRPDFCKRENGL